MNSQQPTANSQQPTANSQQPDACAAPGFSADALKERARTLTALLRQAAPEIISDGQIDIRRLQQLLKPDQPDPPAAQEHYELGWAGKAAARREIQQTTSDTLLPDAGNPPQAPHMLIEGENLQVLRILQKSYYGKVKMIYIDPPYNTGNDSFVYPDDYSETLAEYQRRTGDKNEAGFLNRQSLWKKNTKENGHYHSAWLSMMYPRLYLARNLLRDDGVIFISIDENEMANLKLLCDEIFGNENYCGDIVWRNSSKNDQAYISMQHEYIICYVKNKYNNSGEWLEKKEGVEEIYKAFSKFRKKHGNNWQAIHEEALAWFKQFSESNPISASKHYSWMDERGIYFPDNISGPNYGQYRYVVLHPVTGRPCKEPASGWRFPEETMRQRISDGFIHFGPDETTVPNNKTYLKNTEFQGLSSVKYKDGRVASKQLSKLIGKNIFSNPKDHDVLKQLIRATELDPDDLILDFFAGSGTTMQAVMELNLEDGGKRQCICVQIPEKLEENNEAWKAGYRSIADITRARIAKVIEKLKKEQPEKTAGLACAQFTLSPSHFRQWRTDVKEDQLHGQLEIFRQSEKTSPQTGHAQTAMLAELLLKMGLGALGVQAIAKSETVASLTVHRVLLNDNRELWLCFEPYQSALKDEIAKARPAQVVLLNSCFTGEKADEQLANLQLELQGLGIALTVI